MTSIEITNANSSLSFTKTKNTRTCANKGCIRKSTHQMRIMDHKVCTMCTHCKDEALVIWSEAIERAHV